MVSIINKVVEIIALASLVYYPSIPLVLIIIHRAAKYWRKLGKKSYYVFLLIFLVIDLASLIIILKYKQDILSFRLYNSNWKWLGAILFIPSLILEYSSIRALSFRTLFALPEINPDKTKINLVTSGIYKYLRHPRYLEFILEILAVSLISGLMANFLLLMYFVPMIVLASVFEERELIDRFKNEYIEYRKTTGRFFPKIS